MTTENITNITENEVLNISESKNLTVLRIFADKMNDVNSAIKKLNKKCDRLGVSHPTVTFSNIYEHNFSKGEYEDDMFAVVEARFKWYSIDVFDIDIKLPEDIKLGDWEPIAYMDHFQSQYIKFDIDKDYNYDFDSEILNSNCQHCETKRNRRKSFILKSKIDGSFKKVGSTCVKDFTGVDPVKFFKAFQHIIKTISDFSSEYYGINSVRLIDYRVFDIDSIWTIAKNVIGIDNEYIKTQWDEGYNGNYRTNLGDATADKVKDVLFYKNTENNYFVDGVDSILVDNIREWLINREVKIEKLNGVDVENEFDSKLKSFSDRKRVRVFEIGFTSWIVDAYNKYVENLKNMNSVFVGNVNDKIKIEGTITLVKQISSNWGTTNLYKIVDNEGNIYSKFGEINKRYTLNNEEIGVGSLVKFTAVVNKHNVYNNVNETVLGRISKF